MLRSQSKSWTARFRAGVIDGNREQVHATWVYIYILALEKDMSHKKIMKIWLKLKNVMNSSSDIGCHYSLFWDPHKKINFISLKLILHRDYFFQNKSQELSKVRILSLNVE